MTQLSRQVLETLWEDGDFVLSRCSLAGEPTPVLVLAPASERPAPRIIARLEHACALRERLDPSSVARPLGLVHHRGLPGVLMEDPGGNLLAQLLGHPWELSQFLRVAISVAAALGRLHAGGLIHRDVNPANMLVNVATGRAWLVGICFVSRPESGQVPAPPEEAVGTLAYIPPEQTGRMNRSIDARSDLYSFGVTLYEMLTGTLPFSATDPMEWVHCHVARHPVPPYERLAGISEQISAIVMKLLSEGGRKDWRVEKRYRRKDGKVIWADVIVGFVPSNTESTPPFLASVIVDITERKRAEEELRQKELALREAQIELAHVSRVTTLGELAASIAHEVNQPLAGIVTNANAGLRWLAGEAPDLNETREAIRRIIRDGKRAGDVIARTRALFKKALTAKERLDINEAIEEVVILMQSELRRSKVSLCTELAATLPPGGMGTGRSIVENHGGRLWAAPNDGPGTTFQFTPLRCP